MRAVTHKPSSTYRLQITEAFDLYAAADLLPYLRDLGVDWVYLSPLLEAEAGSDHGYDVVRHERVDPSRGGGDGLAVLADRAHRLGLGVLVDIVPNHMGVATPADNPWWWELLRDGVDGPRGSTFDVDWAAGDGRILLPVVGDDDLASDAPAEAAVSHLSVVGTGDEAELHYYDNRLPTAPGTAYGSADEVHARQHYRLVNWRQADDHLNYRRFFAVNTLAAIRVEDADVLAESHAEIRRWFDEDLVDGLRVDHPDGVRDPEGYLEALAELTRGAYVLVEKILEPGEELPAQWSTEGTTGYDALAWIDRVLTDPEGEAPLSALDARLRDGRTLDWHELIHDTKLAVATGILGSETHRIVREVVATIRHAQEGPGATDEQPGALDAAVAELLACFPVYRSYLPEGRAHLDQAFAAARDRRPDLAAAFDALLPVLSDPEAEPARRFQQTSGMVMAKGVEDCAFYRYSRLTSLNEVGGDPSVFSCTPAAFHGWAAQRQREWPDAMTALTTHDTKRGEDVRARIAVLAEIPDAWAAALTRLLGLSPVPDAGFGALLWQAILGAWPAGRKRLLAYADKAMREAGDRTTWTAPDEDYEAAVHRAVEAAFSDREVSGILETLAERMAGPGWSNALSAKLLALTLPGVPDVYQGSELWEQSLVDPDNRRPVDFEERADLLGAVRDGARTPLTHGLDDPGTAKLGIVHAGLTLRRERPDLFGGYQPLLVEGSAADHALAFDRGGAVTVVTRLPVGLTDRGGWGDTVLRLPEGDYVDQVTGRAHTGGVRLAELLADLPVALLAREDSR